MDRIKEDGNGAVMVQGTADTGLGRLAEHAPSGNLGSYPTQDKEVSGTGLGQQGTGTGNA